MADAADPSRDLLRRLERTAMWITAAGVVVAVLVPGGGWLMASAVLGGALLAGTSYWAIKLGVTSLTEAVAERGAGARSGVARTGLVILRYALLAGMAYVMIARLRLPPLGLLGGASAFVGAAVLELLRGSGPRSGTRR